MDQAASPPAARPARRGRPRKSEQERSENPRHAELLREAARLFRAQGFDATSIRDIAAAAGMQSGSPFYYFESKSALLFAVMRDGMAQAFESQAQALAALDRRASARQRLQTLIRHHLGVVVGAESHFIPVMLYEWRALTPTQRADILVLKDTYEAAWMPTLERLHRAGELKARPAVARLFVFGALNWAAQWFDPAGPLSLDELTEQALRLFIHPRPTSR